jgi:Matrixin
MKTILLAVVLVAGCGQFSTKYEAAEYPPSSMHIAPAAGALARKIWIDPNVPTAPVLAGAAVWLQVGITSVYEPDSALADVHVRSDGNPDCTGEIWYGNGDVDGDINLHMSCFVDKDGPINIEHVAAHEFGHVIGLGHIPQEQPALMNAFIDDSVVPVLTDADVAAFRAH